MCMCSERAGKEARGCADFVFILVSRYMYPLIFNVVFLDINKFPSCTCVCIGLAVCSLRPIDSCAPGEAPESHKQLWGVLRDKQVWNLSLCDNNELWYFIFCCFQRYWYYYCIVVQLHYGNCRKEQQNDKNYQSGVSQQFSKDCC